MALYSSNSIEKIFEFLQVSDIEDATIDLSGKAVATFAFTVIHAHSSPFAGAQIEFIGANQYNPAAGPIALAASQFEVSDGASVSGNVVSLTVPSAGQIAYYTVIVHNPFPWTAARFSASTFPASVTGSRIIGSVSWR